MVKRERGRGRGRGRGREGGRERETSIESRDPRMVLLVAY